MHDTAYRIGGMVMNTYLPSSNAHVLEIGSFNVNGTLRDHAPAGMNYVGLDFEAGDGVDIVITGRDDWNVPDDHFDLVMASSVLEHDPEFWKTFVAMCRKTKSGGHLYISAPSNGTVHRYPKDYWRFYPDAGLALCETARGEGLNVTLVESFIAEREADGWNDFCAIFRIGAHPQDLNSDFVYTRVSCTNAIDWRSADVVNSIEAPEDARLLRTARDQGHILRLEGEALRQQLDSMRDAHLREQEDTAEMQARLTVEMAGQETLRRTLEANLQDAQVRQQAAVTAIEGLESKLRETIDTLEAERAQVQAYQQEIETLIDQKIASEQRLNERFREIAGLTRLIQERDQHIAREEAKAECLRQMVAVLTRGFSRSFKSRLAALIPAWFSQLRQKADLKRGGLFDSAEYIAANPDVGRSGADPLRHYINHGLPEGRLVRPHGDRIQ